MNRILATVLTLTLLGGASVSPAFSLDKEVDLEVRRIDARLARLNELSQNLMRDVRKIQRSQDDVTKKMDYMDGKLSEVLDELVRIQNVDIANLRAGQKGLYDQIPSFTWGEDTEDCADIKTKHQQINTVKSKDGLKTLRYLCFDGKAIHLGTEYHGIPE